MTRPGRRRHPRSSGTGKGAAHSLPCPVGSRSAPACPSGFRAELGRGPDPQHCSPCRRPHRSAAVSDGWAPLLESVMIVTRRFGQRNRFLTSVPPVVRGLSSSLGQRRTASVLGAALAVLTGAYASLCGKHGRGVGGTGTRSKPLAL